MAVYTICYAEIYLIRHKFISFDFGDFAVVIWYNAEKNVTELHTCFGDNYAKKFMATGSSISVTSPIQ